MRSVILIDEMFITPCFGGNMVGVDEEMESGSRGYAPATTPQRGSKRHETARLVICGRAHVAHVVLRGSTKSIDGIKVHEILMSPHDLYAA